MLRGRIGGGGAPFNLGEATVTRATVRLDTGEVGFAYALGRDAAKARARRHARRALAARRRTADRDRRSLAPLRAGSPPRTRTRRRAETAATRVDFFTLVRGED